jgi:cytochrome c oxidase subunit 2
MLEHFLPRASSYSGDIDQLVWIVTWLVGVSFVAAEVMLFWLIFRFRARDGHKAQYVTGKEKHLKKWINIPHAVTLVFDVLIIVAAIRVWVLVKQTLPPADRTVRVVSQQWAWTFQDPGADDSLDTADDIRTTDVMHLEVGKTYHFRLESKDVLHSFFIPAFRLKQDAVPGRTYTGWFKPTRAGTFDLQCAEICGLGHGVMGARVVVDTKEQHAAWVRANTPGADATGGATPDSTATAVLAGTTN